jgi:hypothetical protein
MHRNVWCHYTQRLCRLKRQRFVDCFLFRDDSKVSLRRIDFPLAQHEMFMFEHVSQYGDLSISSIAHVVS